MRLTRPIRAVFGLEIRTLLRDRRTLFMAVIFPILLLPVFLFGSAWVEDRQAQRDGARTFRIALVGSEAAFAETLLADLLRSEAAVPGTAAGEEAEPVPREEPVRFRLRVTHDAGEALDAGEVDLYVEALTPAEWQALRATEDVERREPSPEADGTPVLRIHFNSSRSASRVGAQTLRRHLSEVREIRRDSLLAETGFPVPRDQVAGVEAVNVATDDEVEGAMLGRYLTLILLGLMILGGSSVSIDTLAGEKERGTLATLLTSAATREEIVTGKLLAVMAVAFAIALVQVLNLWIFLGLGIIEPPAGLAVHVTPARAVGLLALYAPVIALTAGVLLLSSAYANSYKEAQLYLTPVLLGLLAPALAPMLPAVSLPSAIMFVPIANLSVAVRDLLAGDVHGPSLLVSWAITALAAGWVTSRSVRALHDEAVITGDTTREEFLGGPALFRKRVLRWFMVFWAVKLLLDLNVQFADIRLTVLFSVGFLFLAFPLFVIRHFRLDPVQALALRRPRAGVWVGVMLGVPAGLVAAQTVFRLMDFVIPVPQELLENFGQALMPENVPTWQLVLLIALVPGITEELTFRGVLLHGLRRRFGPWGLALVVGGIFGFFHFQIFRIPATAALGVVLTLVTIHSGSIFPAIVWHTLNNGLAVFLSNRGWESHLESWWLGLGSFVLLAVSILIIRRFGTPYPDVGGGARGGEAGPEP
ncbi:MAG: CPBP family intramembrane metalloprotease [Gemmatimonadales bacterium]|nr:MAG: CPBP family intramembrane metalloprotease [Gemmatimonadales bacterium]